MTMHLVGPYLTTTRYNSRRKKNKKQLRADAEHEAWLRKRGLHPDQKPLRDAMRDAKGKVSLNNLPDYKEQSRETAPLSNNIAVRGGFKTGVMDNIYKEKPEVQEKIREWANRVAPLYNKGGLQVVTDGTDITTIGSKSRRG